MRAAVCATYHPNHASRTENTTGCHSLQSSPAAIATGVAVPVLFPGRNCSSNTDALYYWRSPECVKGSSASGQPNIGSCERKEQELLQLGVHEEVAGAAGLSPAQVAAVVVTRRAQTTQVPALEARPAPSQHSTGLLQESEPHRKDPGTHSVQIQGQGRVPDHLTGQVQQACPLPEPGSSRTGPTSSLPTTITGPSTFANNHMNELIGILRADVGELRSQGTSLAKQLWLLYVTFEDFMHIHHPKRATKLLRSSLSSDNRWSQSTGNLAGYPSASRQAEKKSAADFLPPPESRDALQEVEVRLTSEADRSEQDAPGTMDKLVSGFSKISCLAEEDKDDALGSRLLSGIPSDTYEGDVTSPGTTSSGYETDQDYMTWQETRMRQGKLFMAALNDAKSRKTLVRTGRHQQTNSMSRDEYVIKADDLYHENYTSSSDNDSATYRRVRRAPIVSGHHENHYSGSPHLRQSKSSTQQQRVETLKVHTEPTMSGGNSTGNGVNGRRRADRIAAKARRSSTEKNRLSELNKTMQSIISDLGQEAEDNQHDECNDLDTTLLTPRGGRGEMSLDSPTTSPSDHWEAPGHDTKDLMLVPRANNQCDSPVPQTPISQDSQGDVTYDPVRACGYEEEGEEEEEGEVELHYPPPHRYSDHPPFYSPQHDGLSGRQRCADWQPHEQLQEMVQPMAHTAHGRVIGVGHNVTHQIHEQSVIQEGVPMFRRQDSYHQDITGAHNGNRQPSSSYQYQHCSSGSISSDSGMASFATGEYSMDYDYGPWASPALQRTVIKHAPQEESIYETIPDHLVSSEKVCRPLESSRQRSSWSGQGTEQLPPDGLGSNYRHRRPSIDSNATSHTYASIDTQLVTSLSDDEGPPPPQLPARNYKIQHRISAEDIRLADCQRTRPGAGNWVDRRRGRVRAPLHLDDIVKASDILADTPGNHMYTVNDVLQSFERLAGHLPTEGDEVPEYRGTPQDSRAGYSNPHKYPQVTPPPPLPPPRYLHNSYSAKMRHAPFHKSQPNLHSVQRQQGNLTDSVSEEPWYLQPCPLRAFTMSTPLHPPPPPPTQAHRQTWNNPRAQALELRGTYC